MLKDFIRTILGKTHYPLNKIYISPDNLVGNLQYLSSLDKNVKIAPVLKSNAYGHGIVEVAKILDPLGAPFFCVDSLYEGYQLLKSKVKTPILIMGYIDPRNLRVKSLPFSYAVYDLELAQTLDRYQKGASVHIKVDTGMHRLGLSLDELPKFLTELNKLNNIKVSGLMSHFAAAKDYKDTLYKHQVDNFQKAKVLLKKFGFKPKWFHIGATEAVLNPSIRKEIGEISNMVRSGKAVYGYSLDTYDPNLKPVLKLTSRIVQIKRVKKGGRVGYDGTFTAPKDMLIGILPIGYNDGVDRRLSNKGVVLIDGTECQITGRVSMNITTISLDNIENPFRGQEVVVISDDPEDPNSIVNMSKICRTIPHDLLVRLVSTTRRELV